MKKRKTYEVSVINKTYSKTYSDQTKFYTSDTALELNFQLKEVEYDFDSAEIILLNVDDRSLVTRPVAKSAEGFTYELEDDIVAHYGEWKGQLKFTEGGEIYVSSPVSFRIENDLTNDRPPQLTEVNTWKNLRAIADGLIADIRNELELVAERLSEMDSAESERQQSEASRVNAEEQRKIDHANRSVELAGKADKVVIKNLITNGDFRDGLNGWSDMSSISLSLENSMLKMTYTSESQNVYVMAPSHNYVTGDVYYARTTLIPQADIASIRHYYNGAYHQPYLLNATPNVETVLSNTFKGSSGGSTLNLIRLLDTDTNVGDSILIKNSMLMNLTNIFGAGNEPTKEEMDELIKVTGYIDGEYALNNKEMLGHLMNNIREKANKKQEDWITVPLLNGAQHGKSPLKVMKDEMGFVHFKGSLTNLVTGDKVFSLPVGYGPDISVTESFIRIPVSLNLGTGAKAVQINYVGDGYIASSSNTEIAFFDGVSYLAKRG